MLLIYLRDLCVNTNSIYKVVCVVGVMTLRGILRRVDVAPSRDDGVHIRREVLQFVELIRREISRRKIDASVFIGGSFAKGTMIKASRYDVDLFIRFRRDALMSRLETIVSVVSRRLNKKFECVHGSRDYFRVFISPRLTIEIIPVVAVRNVEEAKNVTDLSYFHVAVVKKRLSKGLQREVQLAKQFCRAQRVYGAESYVRGFSGYGLECLIMFYRSFERMLRGLVKVKEREKLVIDPAKLFKKKSEVLFSLNEARLESPVIVIDPTWKERNVLAALSYETFRRFQNAAAAFLKNPSTEFFDVEAFSASSLKKSAMKKKAAFVHVVLETKRQQGDIAGTKLKKVARFLRGEIDNYFDVLEEEFVYGEMQRADAYFVVRSKKEIIRKGPPVDLKKHAAAFRKRHRGVFEIRGILHARIRVGFSCVDFLRRIMRSEKQTLRAMGITRMRIAD